MISAEVERRVLHVLRCARGILPNYANGGKPVSKDELGHLIRCCRVGVHCQELDQPTLLLPPMLGRYRLIIDPNVHRGTRDGYLKRHELGHVLAGDVDELTAFVFHDPLPEAELVADVFAFADLLMDEDLRVGHIFGVHMLVERMRKEVSLNDGRWYRRVPRTAEALLDLYQRGSLW